MNIISRLTLGLALGLVLASSTALAAVSETEEHSFNLSEGGRVSVSNINGDISVQSSSGDVVKVIARKKAGTKEYLDELKIVIEASDDYVRIETRHPDSNHSWFGSGDDKSGSVSYEITVPEGAQLDSIETVNGDINISGAKASVNVSSVNGDLDLTGLEGDARLETVNGSVTAQFDTLGAGQRVRAEAVNGRIRLKIPASASARIHAETLNGGIDADDFGLEVDKGYVGRELDGEIGGGEADVNIDTVNGSIDIKMGN